MLQSSIIASKSYVCIWTEY